MRNPLRIIAIVVSLMAGVLVPLPISADEIPACGGLYTFTANRCTLPEGLIEYAVELAGGQGGAGADLSGMAASSTGIGGYGAIQVANITKQPAVEDLYIGIGQKGNDGFRYAPVTEIPGGSAMIGSAGGASWGGNVDRGSQGGSGGGASDLRTQIQAISSRFLVAGAGGGGGADANRLGGPGGSAGSNGRAGQSASGSFSDLPVALGNGQSGTACTGSGLTVKGGSGGGGGAGTLTNSGGGGGAGCANSISAGTGGLAGTDGSDVNSGGYVWSGGRAGAFGEGGWTKAELYDSAGGGGGGGFTGGGAGGAGAAGIQGYGSGGGGGGGSSYRAENVTLVAELTTNTGNGYAQVSAITSALPASTFTSYENFSHQINVTGFLKSASSQALTVTYSMTGAPSELSINPSTGLISGSMPDEGSYTVTVTASAVWSAGNVIRSTQQFSFSVSTLKQTSSLTFAQKMKKKSSRLIKLDALKTSAGQEIVLATTGACSIRPTYKYVKTKVGKKTKKVKTLVGYTLKMGKKPKKQCTVVQEAKPTGAYETFNVTSVITTR